MRTLLVLTVAGAIVSGCTGNEPIALGPVGDAVYAKGGGGFNTPNADATVAGAVTTPSPQSVRAGGTTTLEVMSSPQWSTMAATHFPNRLAAGLTGCVIDPANAPTARVNALFSKLADVARQRQLGAWVDLARVGEASSSNRFALHTSLNDSLFTVSVAAYKALGNLAPTVTSPSSGAYVYSGGGVAIMDRTGGASKHLHIYCSNVDELTLTVVPRS